ncbi:hypothetical protein [Prochlorococcus marinus]|uniref:hypothetical protein n=1 Tax=Prochlorococcus marinus TaxID=1219 RepID=UPI001F47BCE3|nr:hypothetical protein [Prochlorococcus marinus]
MQSSQQCGLAWRLLLLSNKDPHAAERLADDGHQQETVKPVSGAMVELMAAAIRETASAVLLRGICWELLLVKGKWEV